MRLIVVIPLLFLFPFLNAQNNVIVDPYLDREILYGTCNIEDFQQEPFADWYNEEYQAYEIDKNTLQHVDPPELKDLEITVVLGTWCHDSQREVPRFLKIAETLGLGPKHLTLLCVDRKKQIEGTALKNLDIQFVPTFIFYRNDKEIGRIIESPDTYLEKDIVNILTFE